MDSFDSDIGDSGGDLPDFPLAAETGADGDANAEQHRDCNANAGADDSKADGSTTYAFILPYEYFNSNFATYADPKRISHTFYLTYS